MNRKEFFKSCAGGLCACAAVSLIPATSLAAEEPKADDWRPHFIKERYAKLIEILSGKMDEEELNGVLHELGAFCSSTVDEWTSKYKGNFEGFRRVLQQGSSGDDASYNRETGIITMTSPARTDCFCPMISVATHTPSVVCNCSLGWQQHTWETILQKKVKVELKESVLRGGTRCVFEIHVAEAPG